MKTSRLFLSLIICYCPFFLAVQKKTFISSPNKAVSLKVNVVENGNLSYHVSYKNKTIIEPSMQRFIKTPPMEIGKQIQKQRLKSEW